MVQSSTTAVDRVVAALRSDLGRRRPGDRLPSSRELVTQLEVSPVTVARALAVLTAEGTVLTRPGAGTFVAEPVERRPSVDLSWQTLALGARRIDTAGLSVLSDQRLEPGSISLANGYLHRSLMPTRLLGMALARAARLADAWERSPTTGLRSLRAWFAAQSGAGIEPDDVLVTTGGQSAITATLRALANAGDPLLVESPTYPGALAVARAAGIVPVPVPTDQDGPLPAALAEAFARTGATAAYLQPTFRNPTGTTLSPERRTEVLAIAADAGAFVVEDDYGRWLGHDEGAPPPLVADDLDGRVISLLSLTKAASPSLRIGAIVARGPVAERLEGMRVVDDLLVPRPMQEATVELVSRSGWDRHLRGLHVELRARADTVLRLLANQLPELGAERPQGGLHVWARLPAAYDEAAVVDEARRQGVTVMAGRSFFAGEPPGPRLRLTFTAASGPGELEVGITRLAAAVHAVQLRAG